MAKSKTSTAAREAAGADASGTSPSATTPVQLLDAAERLFAERGIDSVSIREIVRASGQSNLSAAHYHFGSREALVAALIERRMRVINDLRNHRLDDLAEAGLDRDVASIIRVTVGVLAEVVRTQAWGPDYVCIMAANNFNPTVPLHSLIAAESMSGLIRCSKMLSALLPDLPAQVFRERIRIVNNECSYSIARWVRAHGTVTATNRKRFDAMVNNLVDFLAAGLMATHKAPASLAARRPDSSRRVIVN